jgi:hypothetical protein
MSDVPESILDCRETIGPWNYSARIPDSARSENYAFLPLLVAAICGGMGMFLANDVAGDVPFWSNAAVWSALMLSAMSILVSIWMFFGRWVWTSPQMAVFSLAGFAPIFWAFQGSSLSAFFLYSSAPFSARMSILLTFLAWHGWWIHQTATRCMAIWANVSEREKVWIPYDCATVYRRSAARLAMEKAGVAWHPGPIGLLMPIFLCIPLYLYRYEVVGYLDVPWVPMIGFVLCLSGFVLFTTALTAIVVSMLVIPARIVASTGKTVLVDMMTPANAPK